MGSVTRGFVFMIIPRVLNTFYPVYVSSQVCYFQMLCANVNDKPTFSIPNLKYLISLGMKLLDCSSSIHRLVSSIKKHLDTTLKDMQK